jgi:hypothetical protein
MIGSVDYLDLFAPGAAWTTASSRIQVLYPEMLFSVSPGSFSERFGIASVNATARRSR